VHSLARDDFLAALAGPVASRAAAEQLVSHRLDAVARADARTARLDSTDS
jgi:hypothetical protein